MKIRRDRIRRAQESMLRHGMLGIMIMNEDDYRYFFGELRIQPRAILPAAGPPIFIGFRAEEEELRQLLANEQEPIKLFSHVGEQISNVRKTFQALFAGPPPGLVPPSDGKPKVGMQMWFHTPAFLVDLFRKANPQVELVPSDSVMDELRMVKEPAEIALLEKAQSIAALGMDRVRETLRLGISGHEVATEALYAMMKAGASGTSTPIYVNAGARSCWIHGAVDKNPIARGDLVVVDLTPQLDGYCANLARTFVLGEPSGDQTRLLEAYAEIHEATRRELKPGMNVAKLDAIGAEICERRGLAQYHLNGISHGIGLRFEETPATTIMPVHRKVSLLENMTVTVGHTVLAVPGVGGVRFEDVFRVTPSGGESLHSYPIEWTLPGRPGL